MPRLQLYPVQCSRGLHRLWWRLHRTRRLLPLLCGRRRLLGHLLRLAGLLVPLHPQRQRLLVCFISFITTPEDVANVADAGHGARAVHRVQLSTGSPQKIEPK